MREDEKDFYVSRWDKFVWDFTLFPLWRFVFWKCKYESNGSRKYVWRKHCK